MNFCCWDTEEGKHGGVKIREGATKSISILQLKSPTFDMNSQNVVFSLTDEQ